MCLSGDAVTWAGVLTAELEALAFPFRAVKVLCFAPPKGQIFLFLNIILYISSYARSLNDWKELSAFGLVAEKRMDETLCMAAC